MTEPTLAEVVDGMEQNVAEAVDRLSNAEARIERGPVGDPAVEAAKEVARRARYDQAHWREQLSWWRWLLDNYPEYAEKPARKASEAHWREVPAAELRAQAQEVRRRPRQSSIPYPDAVVDESDAA